MADEAEAEKEPLEGELIPLLRGDYEGDEENAGGRPRMYDSPEAFSEGVNRYYQDCQRFREPLTLTGMCLHMGFSGRDAMFRYATYDGFLHAVTRARTLVEYGYEKAVLMDKNNAAARLITCIAGSDFWNPAQKIEVPGLGSHEDRLEHLR
jgi:hypothetical protein